MNEPSEEVKKLLKQVVEHYDQEDRSVRERQIRSWRRLKMFWEGFQHIWYSEVARDWRTSENNSDNNDQDYYDKPVNVFRAYLESIIAALSSTVPPVTCYPDNADSPLDLSTSKAGDKIAKLIYRHNDAPLLWLHGLFISTTEGMVAAYNYTKEDSSYGTYKEKQYEEELEEHDIITCVVCGETISDNLVTEEGLEELSEEAIECPFCKNQMIPNRDRQLATITKLVGETEYPKSRQIIEVYGGLYVKIPNYAKRQADCPYLIWSYETDFALARDAYPDIREKIQPGEGSSNEPYERWGRLNPQYRGEYPDNNVTIRNAWLRPSAFETLDEEDCKELKKAYPVGVKVVLVNDTLAECISESLDEHWTITYNPLADQLHHDPIGLQLVPLQEITNDLVSLILQTIEHGIPQTFADPRVINFNAYRSMESAPGSIFPATPRPGTTSLRESFHEVKTATLSGEVLPFFRETQGMAQLVSGSLPSLFGGEMGGSKTASEYSMSRQQALQRLQTTWKMLTSWWKAIFAKVIVQYIQTIKDDEKFVEKDENGNFINIFIKRAELEGKIGNIELEANENLPISWAQQRDIVLQLMQANNPQLLEMISNPENLPLLYETIGLSELYIPGEDDRNKQYEEIKELLNTEPITVPLDFTPEITEEAMMMGQELQQEELPSVDIDPDFDNHAIHFEICRKWIVGEAGRLAKTENSLGYKNVLLHAKQHQQILIEQQAAMQLAAEQESQGARPLKKPDSTQTKEAPITSEGNVNVQV